MTIPMTIIVPEDSNNRAFEVTNVLWDCLKAEALDGKVVQPEELLWSAMGLMSKLIHQLSRTMGEDYVNNAIADYYMEDKIIETEDVSVEKIWNLPVSKHKVRNIKKC